MGDARDRYFVIDAAEAAQGGGFLNIDEDVASIPFNEGLAFRPILGTNVLLSVVDFAPNSVAPRHIHNEEQLTIVIAGELEFEVGGETRLMRPGDVAVIPPNVPHGGRTRDSECREIDVFNPPRQALIDLIEEAQRNI